MQPAADLHVGNGAKVLGNVTGFNPAWEEAERLCEQEDTTSGQPLGHRSVIGGLSSDAPAGGAKAAGKKQAKAGNRRKRKPKKRGPRGSPFLESRQVKDVDHLAHVARREGVELNYCLTIRSSKGVSDAEGKREINSYLKRVCEALRDRGQEWIAVWVYEKQPHLHAHALIYVARGNLALLKQHAKRSGRALHIGTADRCGPEYVTKQRRPRQPEVERQDPRRRIAGAHIDGPRLGYSKAAKTLLNRFPPSGSWSGAVDAWEKRPLPPEEPRPPAQLGLPLDWIPSRPSSDAALIAQFCEIFGYTQREAAEQIGYRDRSHVANILRGHDGMSPPRRRYVEYLLETGEIR